MGKHTKGPWHIHANQSSLGFRIDSAGNEWQGLAKVYQAPDLEKEGEANARLIAAAPELLEELKKCCVLINKTLLEETFNPNNDNFGDLAVRLQKLTAIIDKAEGNERKVS